MYDLAQGIKSFLYSDVGVHVVAYAIVFLVMLIHILESLQLARKIKKKICEDNVSLWEIFFDMGPAHERPRQVSK